MIAPDTVGTAEGERVLDHAKRRPDPTRCPLGLPHRAEDSGCLEFRRAVMAKGLRAPRGGWVCQPAPADTTIPSVGWSR